MMLHQKYLEYELFINHLIKLIPMKHSIHTRFDPWRELAVLMLLLMDVSWLTPWFRSLTPDTYAVNSWRVFIVFTIFIFISHVAVRLMEQLRLKKRIRQAIMILMLSV